MVDKILSCLILKDTSGTPSWSLSLAVMSFFVTVFLMLFGGQSIDLTIGTFSFKTKIAPIDAGVIAIFFPTSMGLYFARRYTSAKVETSNFGISPMGPGIGGGVMRSDYSDMEFKENPPVVTAKPRKPCPANNPGIKPNTIDIDDKLG